MEIVCVLLASRADSFTEEQTAALMHQLCDAYPRLIAAFKDTEARESVMYLSKLCDAGDRQLLLSIAKADFQSATLDNAESLLLLHLHHFNEGHQGNQGGELLAMLCDGVRAAWDRWGRVRHCHWHLAVPPSTCHATGC